MECVYWPTMEMEIDRRGLRSTNTNPRTQQIYSFSKQPGQLCTRHAGDLHIFMKPIGHHLRAGACIRCVRVCVVFVVRHSGMRGMHPTYIGIEPRSAAASCIDVRRQIPEPRWVSARARQGMAATHASEHSPNALTCGPWDRQCRDY